MKLEAAVDDHLGPDQGTEAFWIELTKLRPLGQVQHHLGAQQRLLDAGYLGEAFAGREFGLRVIDAHVRPRRVHLISNGERGAVPGVISAGFERGP